MRVKVCTKCKKSKSLDEFGKSKNTNDGYSCHCKKCRADYIKKNKLKIAKYQKEYHKNFPWMVSYNHARQRCNNPKNEKYKYYGGKGIKFLLTKEEIKELWFRDTAYEMERPSIDRKKNDGDYTFDNCQFIEFRKNSIKDKRKSVYQYDLEGNLIQEWSSQNEASRETRVKQGSISSCIKGKSKTTGGFIWRNK